MSSRTTWKNRATRAAVALGAVALIALWVVVLSVIIAFAKRLPSPWDGVLPWGVLALFMFVVFYVTTGPTGRDKSTTRYEYRSPTRRDRDARLTIWYQVGDGDLLVRAWVQRGPQWFPRWREFDTAFRPGQRMYFR